jgi:hypothetical protein
MPAVVGASLRWLAGYRHERVCDDGVAARGARLSTTTPDVGYGSSSKDYRSAFRSKAGTHRCNDLSRGFKLRTGRLTRLA